MLYIHSLYSATGPMNQSVLDILILAAHNAVAYLKSIEKLCGLPSPNLPWTVQGELITRKSSCCMLSEVLLYDPICVYANDLCRCIYFPINIQGMPKY